MFGCIIYSIALVFNFFVDRVQRIRKNAIINLLAPITKSAANIPAKDFFQTSLKARNEAFPCSLRS